MARMHSGSADRFDLFLRQLSRREAPAAVAISLELLVLVRTDEIAGDLAMAGNRDWMTLSAHPVAAKITRELRRRYGLCRSHDVTTGIEKRVLRNLRKSRKSGNKCASIFSTLSSQKS